ncbi:DoxX family protein [Bosea vestrisii]|uniref:DoxX family protein n=1 Tax=Bosea vestrisii TaxID=151416 RepID=UPI0024DFEED2|nr:DoxX family protein [Bosea vestrisii]WID96716.1 DoxX family protein [Bosea vestrisii]
MSAGRRALLWLLAAFYLAAGLLHLRSPSAFLPIVPDWVPAPQLTVIATGIAEIIGALGLLIPRLRKTAGIGLALYALCVLPANLKHAFEGVVLSELPSSWWYHGPRLAFQPVLIWAALYASAVTNWPWRRLPHK